MQTNKIIQGDSLSVLKTLPSESISCVMTSPPYWALRDYGNSVESIWDGNEDCDHQFVNYEKRQHSGRGEVDSGFMQYLKGHDVPDKIIKISGFCQKCGAWKGQLGLEPTFDLYIKHLCDIFDEVKRVLRKDGTCWVNLGDTYASTPSGLSNKKAEEWENKGDGLFNRLHKRNTNDMTSETTWKPAKYSGVVEKSLCNIPARFSIEMQNRGWILRNVIIWHKPNCIPSSIKDRFTVDFEYLFFFVKNKKYWFETQYEPIKSVNDKRVDKGREEHIGKSATKQYSCSATVINSFGRNKRTVWSICPQPFKEAHFATYPEKLCETPIKAGCPEFICNKCGKAREKIVEKEYTLIGGKSDNEKALRENVEGWKLSKLNSQAKYRLGRAVISGINQKGLTSCSCNSGFSSGIVLDPFFGAGTTGLVALKLNRQFIGIELNPEYIKIANERLKPYLEQTKLP